MDAIGRAAVMTIRTVADKQAEASARLDLTKVSGRRIEFDYLRACVITLVLFVHAALAYTTAAFFNSENPIASSNPIENAQRWMGFDCGVTTYRYNFVLNTLF